MSDFQVSTYTYSLILIIVLQVRVHILIMQCRRLKPELSENTLLAICQVNPRLSQATKMPLSSEAFLAFIYFIFPIHVDNDELISVILL